VSKFHQEWAGKILIGLEFSCSDKGHQGLAQETRIGHVSPVTLTELLKAGRASAC